MTRRRPRKTRSSARARRRSSSPSGRSSPPAPCWPPAPAGERREKGKDRAPVMTQTPLDQRSRLVPAGIVLTAVGAVGFLLGRLYGPQIEAVSQFLLLAVILLALGLLVGPVLWLVG